ncbi:hypothetical protein, variant [Exophiala mesophila]|uniref:Uncharacterized protein n=1 Tax=Exophiala mesophila TaxID=212818 RepID=A0A0D2ABG1_EXOME|nr:uncharacterized protein PV10_00151 [Exophiala mesophila]XP_016227842.1 hypothetical protein, variant [Exophiala mesophila]KIV96267.1 hypothetical protein PV10_00151 [Exophiala mesophila]KIV96268.1 hypothetical protein, variant [Exophiala mesophila]
MKPLPWALALCVHLALAVPHDHHQHRHPARALETAHVIHTEIVTVTASNAVVWVDQHGNVLSTDFPGFIPTYHPTTTTTTAPSSSTTSESTTSETIDDEPSSVIESSTWPEPTETYTSDEPPVTDLEPSSAEPTSAAPTTTSVPGGNKDVGNMGGLGVCYELIDGAVKCKSSSVLNSEFAFLKSQGFSRVRVYDIGCPLGDVAAAASQQGLSLIAGLNTVGNVAGDLAKLVGMLSNYWSVVDTIVIGNEVVNNNPGLAGAVVAGLSTARSVLSAAGFNGHIVTVDTFIAHAGHPELCAASDYCAVNAYAFFDANTAAADAGNFVLNTAIGMVQKIANGKQIVVTESGWPWQGQSNGKAIPSRENQQTAIASLRAAFAGSSIPLFLFQAYDASYKAPGHLGVEPYFGIYGS